MLILLGLEASMTDKYFLPIQVVAIIGLDMARALGVQQAEV